ncbi:NH(3)-dependent NAD(+) synthetase [Ancylomarina subtilis]|uniref:Glutamine-dependent NAD(+) synthetase n=1 Tax=Ancylomarina subtilis TaxID=1639035 RepID=A0A4Q7VDT7_9BACT|nr:NAD+ synthase [Ancylomarina subtilis]RZT93162.1 NH(3)-dependent NAD(+) synthetase [Ancylomarina subtilis]
MKIVLAQLNYHIGNFELNTDKIITAIEKAKTEKADLVVFSELAICGYPPKDLLERKDFIEKTQAAMNQVATHCIDIAAVVGGPSINPHAKGKNLYNSAFFISEGKIQSIHNKTLLPTYDIFDEYRYFEPNTEYSLVEYKGKKIAITICEDLWEQQPVDNNFAKEALYTISPMEQLNPLKPDFVVNIAASPFSHNQRHIRTEILHAVSKRYQLPLIYVNQIGANTELIFDGDSMVLNSKGDVACRLNYFEEDYALINLDEIENLKVEEKEIDYIEKIHDALVLGLKDYFQKMGFKKATLGLSGGIDSAVTVVLAERALGKENVRVLLMPSEFSSDHSVKDAIDLANNLGIQYEIVPIQDIFKSFEASLAPIFGDLPFNVAEENIQARIRGTLMMGLSNKFGHILLNTSNKSESAVGYGTLYGDMNGGLAVLGDVYKTDVFKLAYYMNKDKEVIPLNSIVKPPSAELRPDQKDSDSLPDYDILDKILFLYIEKNMPVNEIIEQGFAKEVVDKIIRLVNMNEYKRFQTAPVLRVSSKAFGYGRKIPLVAKH